MQKERIQTVVAEAVPGKEEAFILIALKVENM
jgi:hypothetical protein